MSLDSNTPLGLKLTHFIVVNFFWYITFAFIFWNPNPFEWWLFINSWGRLIVVLLELSLIGNVFLSKRKRKV